MHDPPSSLPSREQELVLHQRLLNLDPTAPSDLAGTYLDHLVKWVCTRNRRIDADLCAQAAADAIIALIKNPASYQPSKQSLSAYLHMSAQGDLRNQLQKEKRNAPEQKSLESVELSPKAGKYLGRTDGPPEFLEKTEEERGSQALLLDVRGGLSTTETSVLDLMLKGEKKTPAFAQVLGISHLAKAEQIAEVKRVKDLIKVRLKRARSRHDQSSP